ncbi:hypothetical protein [Nocardiopsis protaetiae]|uniref:hypothetical protein n=1 Tax=Nocardiopsis protaetiae TaxID=3382270 RepID=UPI00387B5D90
MEGLLSEVGKKLTDRWFTLLALPGALYLAVAVAAVLLGRDRTWDLRYLAARAVEYAADERITTLGGQVVLFAVVIAAGSVVGLCAQALGSAIGHVWTAERWLWGLLSAPVVACRRRLWLGRRIKVSRAAGLPGGGDAAQPVPAVSREAYQRAYGRMARISPERPLRPTWCADRLMAVPARFERDHALKLPAVWPHLWLLLPEETRTVVATAREDLRRAHGLVAWGVLYAALAVVWWPALLLGAAVAAGGWVRTRRATEAYAVLLEVVTLAHIGRLAEQLKVPYDGFLDMATGGEISRRLTGSLPPVG